MIIGLLRESLPETRVSLTDEGVMALIKKGIDVVVEQGAGSVLFAMMMLIVRLVQGFFLRPKLSNSPLWCFVSIHPLWICCPP